MKHIRQRNDLDCGYAVAAMLAGVDYDDAGDVDPSPESEDGIHVSVMAQMLADLTNEEWKITRKQYHVQVRDACVPCACAVLVRPPRAMRYHWIALNAKVYDPERARPMDYAAYDRGDWLVVRVLLPEEATRASSTATARSNRTTATTTARPGAIATTTARSTTATARRRGTSATSTTTASV